MLDAKSLLDVLDYDPETGKLFWKIRPASMFTDAGQTAEHRAARFNAMFGGKEAFTCTGVNGYKEGRAGGRTQLAHRVIWALVHGDWPNGEIDHINGDRTDNRLSNLRVVDRIGNMRNLTRRHDNSSGVTGVYFEKRSGKWVPHIRVNGRNRYLGRFDLFEDAVSARKRAERKHGFHENHGKPSAFVGKT